MTCSNNKSRLDALLTQRGLAESRERAKAVIMSGNVYVDGNKATKPGMQISDTADIKVLHGLPYVSRGGLKLEKALDFFNISADGKVCIDCGASTGGFTDCLLQNGAKLVYAVDVGYGQLAWSLRTDSRVIVMERTNIRNANPDAFEPKSELAVVDLSFISLALILPVVKNLLTDDGEVLCLIKPQFEAGREKVGKKGVVRNSDTHKEILLKFLDDASKANFVIKGLTHSPIKGPEGNIEFFGFLSLLGDNNIVDVNNVVEIAHEQLGANTNDKS